VAASGTREACSLKLRLNNASLAQAKAVQQTLDEEGGPLAVDLAGFLRPELNTRYAVRQDVVLHGRRTYWTREAAGPSTRFFIAWQKVLGRWAICERVGSDNEKVPLEAEDLERCRWQAFQLDCAGAQSWTWAHLLEEGRWMERQEAGWGRARVVQVTPAAPRPMGAPRQQVVDCRPTTVDFSGFRRLELNARYCQRTDVVLQGRPSYWDSTSRFFIYWQSSLRRWAISGKQALDAARQGQCLGCACQLDLVHFTTPSRWVEFSEGSWSSVPVEVTLVAAFPVDDNVAETVAPSAPSRSAGGEGTSGSSPTGGVVAAPATAVATAAAAVAAPRGAGGCTAATGSATVVAPAASAPAQVVPPGGP